MTKLVFVNSDGNEKSVEAENGLSLMEIARDNDLGIEGLVEDQSHVALVMLLLIKNGFRLLEVLIQMKKIC